MYRPRTALVALLMAILLVPCAFAQETTAGIQGSVKDPSGAVVANATIELTGTALLGSRKVTTDSSGVYRFAQLPVGTYTMTISAPGFRSYKQSGIELTAGRLPSIDVTLVVGAVAETVEVSSAAPIVDVTRTSISTAVSAQALDNMPKGRSFQSVIPFAPGARNEPLQGPGQTGFQIDGASDSENVYMIDGVNITNIQNGGVGKQFQMDFLDEVQVKSSSFEAEFGGALGGVVNAVPKRGTNEFHGTLVFYWQNQAMNANGNDRSLRSNPLLPSLNTTTRLDATNESFYGRPDQVNIVEPGYTLGGPLLKNKLWIFSSYIPSVSTTRRTTNFIGANPGPRTLVSTTTQHNAFNRLDYSPLNSLRLYSSWNYAYFRQSGALGGVDSLIPGQRNTGATTDPNTIRSDAGSVNPFAVYSYGADWTPTAKLVISARYGYFFNNTEQRGTPQGVRYVYANNVPAGALDLAGVPVPVSLVNSSGFANIPSNLATAFDAYKRDTFSVDGSYFTHFLEGTHTFKVGFFTQRQSNDVLRTFNGGAVSLSIGNNNYPPVTSATACDAIKAQNLTNFGNSTCQGRYGYFTVGTGVVNTGGDQQTAKALYFQDAWTVGHGLTLNLGIRFDQETQPAYDPTRFPEVRFGWGDKIAPRLGGAYDLLHNGKVKIYASYGKFFDIMKMGLARGSFGSDYWHNCVYALDDPDYTKITPTFPIGGGCPASGPAPGVTTGRFIENVDFRATKADPRDPAISPNFKPMKQHEFVTGVDWQINNNWSLETRYARKRLDETIEDMAITDNLGFYIGNPGSPFADLLHRPTVIPNAAGVDYLNTTPFCAECPPVVPAIRRYDGLEFRLTKRMTSKWGGSFSYTYSSLTGNYAGLTNSDPTDGNSGRHSPNNGRAFDIPTQTYTPSGKIDDGPLSTDRPHTAKAFLYYQQKWGGKNTTVFGLNQIGYQGTPINTCLAVVGSSSACQWGAGRGNFLQLSRAATGDIVVGSALNDTRTDNLLQTDFNIRHEISVSEGKKLSFEANVLNALNQRNGVNYYEFAIPTTQLISPTRASRFSGDPGVDWGKVMNGYNVQDALNATGAFAGVQTKSTYNNKYGLPQAWQAARNIRLAIKFTF